MIKRKISTVLELHTHKYTKTTTEQKSSNSTFIYYEERNKENISSNVTRPITNNNLSKHNHDNDQDIDLTELFNLICEDTEPTKLNREEYTASPKINREFSELESAYLDHELTRNANYCDGDISCNIQLNRSMGSTYYIENLESSLTSFYASLTGDNVEHYIEYIPK